MLQHTARLPSLSFRAAPAALTLALLLALGEGLTASEAVAEAPTTRTTSPSSAWDRLTDIQIAEEVQLLLGQKMRPLKHALLDLHLAPGSLPDLFADEFEAVDLGPGHPAPASHSPTHGEETVWGLATPTVPPGGTEGGLWSHVLDEFQWIDDAKFGPIRGTLLNSRTTYAMHARASVRGRTPTGDVLAVDVLVDLEWQRTGTGVLGQEPTWEITRWASIGAHGQRRRTPLFREALSDLLTDAGALGEARRSRHEELVEHYLADPVGFERPWPEFDVVSHDRHPAIAVVDIDADGQDELYVVGRHGPARLWMADSSGAWADAAPTLGLDLEGGSAPLFLDVDNDGDLDLFLGGALTRSRLLIRADGGFVDRSSDLLPEAPMLVSSVAAADYDGDGLTDLHVATYAQKAGWERDPLLAPDEETASRLLGEHNAVRNNFGPRNMLLRNLGAGRLEPAEEAAGVVLYRHSYQATWSDYDGDGAV
ncbi:MAG: VCBS repeat-containing protein, partial [Deltaproteobacteria bacterium]|nr:VCBS repeat-containing protein [Deltaproteobacteria bacterium]